MKNVILGGTETPAVIVGCMRLGSLGIDEMNRYIHTALEVGVNYFDHADIYGNGASEELFGDAFSKDNSIKREDIIIQSKCGICNRFYDLSQEYILKSVDGILSRLKVDYLDYLLLHRPDALVEPEEVASAFEKLEESGKVRHFGVSNHKPMQIELLKKYVKQPLVINQMQLSIPVSNMISNGIEVNMETEGSIDRDGSILDYCRINDITIQAWSPFQMSSWRGTFMDNNEYGDLNKCLEEVAQKYNATKTMIAAAWILRHPANMQVIAGTTNEKRLKEIVSSLDINLTREEWYKIYLASNHILP